MLKRRKLLGLLGAGAGVAVVTACAPAASAPSPAALPTAVAPTRTAAAATPVPTASPAPQTPRPSPTPIADPLIDNHAHPIPPAQGSQTAYYDGIVQKMDENGVSATILHRNGEWTTGKNKFGPEHDDWVRAAMERHPGRLLGYVAGFDPASPDAPAYVRTQLQTGKWKAVGELDLRNPGPQTKIPVNSPMMNEIHKIAAEFGVPVVIHYNFDYGVASAQVGFQELDQALAANPQTTIVLAHNPAPDLMRVRKNLWCEVSPFTPQAAQILGNLVQLDPALLDRIVLCVTDLQGPDLMVGAGLPVPITYAAAASAARKLLATLTKEQADKIAYKNITRLLKL